MTTNQRYSQRTVNIGLQKTLLDVAESLKKIQMDNDPKVSLRKALDFLQKNSGKIILLIGFLLAFKLGQSIFKKK